MNTPDHRSQLPKLAPPPALADTYKPDQRMDKMRKLLNDDPEAFDRLYGARGHIVLGMHESAQEAAGDGPEAA